MTIEPTARAALVPGLILLLLCSGCATPGQPLKLPVDSGYRLRVNQAYGDLANYTTIYFQAGHRVIEKELDRWTTYCGLRVFDRRQGAAYRISVAPGEFAISRVRMWYQSSEYPYYGLSSESFGTIVFGLFDGSAPDGLAAAEGPPDYYLYQVEMKLTSPDQADVRTLTCSRKWGNRGNYFPTLENMRGALGSLIEISASGFLPAS